MIKITGSVKKAVLISADADDKLRILHSAEKHYKPGRSLAFIQVREILENLKEELSLEVLTGESGLGNKIRTPNIQMPGLALVGFQQHIVPHRVQIFGQTEIEYILQQDPAAMEAILKEYFDKKLCCCVVSRNLTPPKLLLDFASSTGTPLLGTPSTTLDFINRLSHFLDERFARRTSMHGVLMDIFGVGVLMLGKSAIGKSECALDLILKGHRLVADDIVELRRIAPGSINGRCSGLTKHHMEIRGLGIINIKEMFGIGAVRDRKKVHVVVKLVEWGEEADYDRIGLDEKLYRIMGVDLPLVTIPVGLGRNLTAIVEVAARNHLLKMEGFHAARNFQEQLLARIAHDAGGDLDGEEDQE